MRKVRRTIFKKPLNVGLMFLVIALLILFINIVIGKFSGINQFNNVDEINTNTEIIEEQSREVASDWETFINIEYGFSVKVPRLLIKREQDANEEYLFFVKFEENRFSEEKGVAIGVSDRNLADEEAKTKEIFDKNFEELEPEKEDFALKGYQAVKLEYKGKGSNEPRVIVLVNDGQYSYSMSTTPDQIDRVMEGFVFLK